MNLITREEYVEQYRDLQQQITNLLPELKEGFEPQWEEIRLLELLATTTFDYDDGEFVLGVLAYFSSMIDNMYDIWKMEITGGEVDTPDFWDLLRPIIDWDYQIIN